MFLERVIDDIEKEWKGGDMWQGESHATHHGQ